MHDYYNERRFGLAPPRAQRPASLQADPHGLEATRLEKAKLGLAQQVCTKWTPYRGKRPAGAQANSK